MKAIVILYTGHKPLKQEIFNGLLNFAISPESATVKVLDDSEVSSLKTVSDHLKQILEVPAEVVENEKVDYADNAADIVINITKSVNPMDIAKNSLMLLRHNSDNSRKKSVVSEFVKACEVLKSGKMVSNGWLQRHGITRGEWDNAQSFINSIM